MSLLSALLFAASLSVAAPTAPASSELLTDLERSKEKLEREDMKRRQVLSALYELNRKIHKSVMERSKLQGERESLEENVDKLNQRLGELDGNSSRLRARLSERLKAMHRLGGPSLARILSSASSASELDRGLKIMGIVAERDRDLMHEYASVQSEIKAKRTKLAARVERLKEIEHGLKAREANLVAEQAVKSRLLEGIRRNRLFAEKNLEEIRRRTVNDASVDDAVLDLLFRPSFADEKGRLPAPVDAKIADRFGAEKSNEQTWTLSRKGIRLAAARGVPMKSVFDGTVAWTGSIQGFGRSLVVDHGDHYYTVYANAEDLYVKTGDEVRRQQVLGTVGAASMQGPGLYFEIRHFSEPYDPQLWLKGNVL